MGRYSFKNITVKGLLLIFILLMAIFARFDGLQNQFPTIDDTGVAWTLLSHTDQLNTAYIKQKIYDSLHEDFNTPQYKFLRRFDKAGSLESGLKLLKPIIKMIIIPQTWTYAPIQFIFTSVLLNNNLSYRAILFWGRFPSFIFSILSLVILILLLRKIFREQWFLPTISGLLLFGFSLENIIYAKHMSNYSASIFSLLLLIYIYIAIVEKSDGKQKTYMYIGFLLAVCVGLSYQSLFFIPAFFGAWLIVKRQTIFKAKGSIKSNYNNLVLRKYLTTLLTFLLLSSLLIFTFIIFRSRRGEAIATGIPERFYFIGLDKNAASTFYTVINFFPYSVTFFCVNGFETIHFLLSNSKLETRISLLSTSIFIFLIIIGLFTSIKSQNRAVKEIGLFIILSLGTYIFLVLFKKIPLSPSRHSLILLPILAILFSFGIFSIFNSVIVSGKTNLSIIIALLLIFVTMVPFWSNYSNFISKRVDLMSNERFNFFLKKANPELIIMPKYFVMNKLLTSDWNPDKDDVHEVYSVYRTSVKGKFTPGVILVINQSDLFFDYKVPGPNKDNIIGRSNELGVHFLADKYYYQTGDALDINKEIKESKNQISFRIYNPLR